MHKKGGVRIPRKSITNGALAGPTWSWTSSHGQSNPSRIDPNAGHSNSDWAIPSYWESLVVFFRSLFAFLSRCQKGRAERQRSNQLKADVFGKVLFDNETSTITTSASFLTALLNELTSLFCLTIWLSHDERIRSRSFILGYYTDWRQSICAMRWIIFFWLDGAQAL